MITSTRGILNPDADTEVSHAKIALPPNESSGHPDACPSVAGPDRLQHLVAAGEFEAKERYLEAAQEYHSALLLDAGDADIWNNFGVTLAKAGLLEEATQAFDRSLSLDPSNVNARRNATSVHPIAAKARAYRQRDTRALSAQGDPAQPRIGLDWQIGTTSGWGIYGLNLVVHALRRKELTPVALYQPELSGATAEQRRALRGLATSRDPALQAHLATGRCPFPLLHALGNGLVGGQLSQTINGTRRLGIAFIEDTALDVAATTRGHLYDRIIAGSTWNEELLKSNGLDHTVLVFQGIDTSVFRPAPSTGRFAGRFVVFSGGKLEYRKGQDLVIAAFARFHDRHPDSLLMVAWHNHWPQTMAEIVTAGHVNDVPARDQSGRLSIVPWLMRHGIPKDAVYDVGLAPNAEMAALVREADVALFPNRAEGGTNLVAMELLASGVPCILSANTGHLDLTSEEHNIVLHRQGSCAPSASFAGTDGWGESDVDEIVAALEFAYDQRTECIRRATNAARIMENAAWTHQIDRLFTAISDAVN